MGKYHGSDKDIQDKESLWVGFTVSLQIVNAKQPRKTNWFSTSVSTVTESEGNACFSIMLKKYCNNVMMLWLTHEKHHILDEVP